MLYILVFTRVSYHFDCCMIFDVVLALYQRCSFRLTGQCEGLNTWNGQRTGSTLEPEIYFSYIDYQYITDDRLVH